MQTLKDARELRGIKQKSIAEYLGISRQTYVKYETNPRLMPIGIALDACEFIGCELSDIFFGENVSKTYVKQ